MVVGQTEQQGGARAGLHILEGHIVYGLPFGEGMTDVAQHLHRGRRHVGLGRRDAERLHQRPGIGLRAVGRGEGRQRPGQDIRARQAERVEGMGGHQQRLGGIEPARDANDDLLDPRRLQPLAQAIGLDVVGLVAKLREARVVIRHEGEARHGPHQAEIGLALRRQGEGNLPEGTRRAVQVGRVAEGLRPEPLLLQPLEVEIGQDRRRVARETRGFGEQHAILVDHRLAVPGEVGAGLARPGRRVEIGRDAARRMHLAKRVAIGRLADGDVARREVQQHRRPGQRRGGGRRHGRPSVLTDLDADDEVGQVLRPQQDVGAKRRLLPRKA